MLLLNVQQRRIYAEIVENIWFFGSSTSQKKNLVTLWIHFYGRWKNRTSTTYLSQGWILLIKLPFSATCRTFASPAIHVTITPNSKVHNMETIF